MSFFSRIKKLWGTTDQQAPPITPDQQDLEDPIEEQVQPLEQPIASLEIDEHQDHDVPPLTPIPDTADQEAQPLADTAKQEAQPPLDEALDSSAPSGGWRKFFGLSPKKETPEEAPEEPVQEQLLFQDKPTIPAGLEPWQEQLAQALRQAEPRLSIWMTHILDGIETRGEQLWSRLSFLFDQLEVPPAESADFIQRFDQWLVDMDYDHVQEFRSELQYRMALALDLEDEEDERDRLLLKLSSGLSKTREQLAKGIDQLLAMTGGYDDAFWEELEEILLMADVGVHATQEILQRLRPKVRQAGITEAADFKALLKEELAAVFVEPEALTLDQGPEVVLMVGVNGAGKTTTIAKLAHRAQMQGRKVLVAAGDTFRAAAIEQLQVWSQRVGASFYAKEHGSDPAAVAFEAVDYAHQHGHDLVFVDTAGRLQTKHNLMEELKKINRVLGKKIPGAPHRTILVLDANTGQNALSQVKLFSEAAPINEIILTKLDGTAKGGIIVAIALEFGLPITFVGLGEKMEDLRSFSGQEFVDAIFG